MMIYDSDGSRFAYSFFVGGLIATSLVVFLCVAGAALEGICVFPLSAGFLGAIAGVIGASGIGTRRAVLYSATVFSSAASVVAFRFPDFGPIAERIWFVLAAGAIGSLCGRAGLMVGRGFPGSEKDPPWLQFSLFELLGLCVPLALLLGYLTHLIRR